MYLRNGSTGRQNLGGPKSSLVHGAICATFSIVQCGWGQIMTGDFTAGRVGHSPLQSGRRRPSHGEIFALR